MTTIALNSSHIAADGRSCFGSQIQTEERIKLHLSGPYIYAVAGKGAVTNALIAWHQAGADPARVPPGNFDWDLLVVSIEDRFIYQSTCPYPRSLEPDEPFAMGSGDDFALAALDLGKTPAEAVAAAAKRDIYTGGRILSWDIRKMLSTQSRITPQMVRENREHVHV